MNEGQSGQIKSLLLVLFSAVGLAIALAAGMIYYYQPSGKYVTANVLLSPEVAKVMSYEETAGGKRVRYQFEGIEYLYYDSDGKRWEKVAVTGEQYQQFFTLIEADRSESELSNSVFQLFNGGTPSMLVLKVRPETSATGQTFQEVQFVEGADYYRLTLRDAQTMGEWVYFHHEGIGDKAAEIFARRSKPQGP